VCVHVCTWVCLYVCKSKHINSKLLFFLLSSCTRHKITMQQTMLFLWKNVLNILYKNIFLNGFHIVYMGRQTGSRKLFQMSIFIYTLRISQARWPLTKTWRVQNPENHRKGILDLGESLPALWNISSRKISFVNFNNMHRRQKKWTNRKYDALKCFSNR